MKVSRIFAIAVTVMAAIVACTPVQPQKGSDEPVGPVVPDEPVDVTIELTELTNLTPTFIASASGVQVGQTFESGDTFTLTLTPGEILSSGFAQTHMEHIHVHVGDQVFMPEFPDVSDEYVQEIKMEIPVPEISFGVVVAYAVQQQFKADGYTMYLEDNEDGIKLFGVSPLQKYKYFDCYLRTPDAYTIDMVEFKVGDGEWEDLTTYEGCRFARTESLDWVYNVTVRPNYQDVTGDITIRVTGTQHGRYSITWKNTEYIKTDIPSDWQQNYLPESSIGGETVVAAFYTLDDYYLEGATSNVSGVNPECIYRAYVRFTMPEEDIEISLEFLEKIPVSYVTSDNILKADIYDQPDIYYGVPTAKGIPGEYVYLFATAKSGYRPYQAVNDAGEKFDFVIYGDGIDRYAYYAPVLIPEDAESMTVSAEVIGVHYVSGENVQVDGGSAHYAGETVSFTVYVPEGKSIESVSVATASGSAVECSFNSPYGSFVMPDDDVVVSVKYKGTDVGDTVHVSAEFDEDVYSVNSSTDYDWNFAEGFDVPTGTNIYLSVYNWYGEGFWVGLKIGESISYYEAKVDPEMGEAEFGRSFAASGNTLIKVGPTKEDVSF